MKCRKSVRFIIYPSYTSLTPTSDVRINETSRRWSFENSPLLCNLFNDGKCCHVRGTVGGNSIFLSKIIYFTEL